MHVQHFLGVTSASIDRRLASTESSVSTDHVRSVRQLHRLMAYELDHARETRDAENVTVRSYLAWPANAVQNPFHLERMIECKIERNVW